MLILIADDHRLIVEGVKLKLAELGPDTQFVVASNADEIRAASAQTPSPDLALVDMAMPGAHGTDHLEALHTALPSLPIIVLSGSEDPAVIRDVLHIGIRGYIPKSYSPDVMLSAIRLVLSGGVYVPQMALAEIDAAGDGTAYPGKGGTGRAPLHHQLALLLTDRQMEVLFLLKKGSPNKVIARDLKISEGTVKIHLAAIFRALSVRNRTEAVSVAAKLDLSAPSQQVSS
ncbi:LuxR family two component transcriptional regulator [Luteibacter rhizovicinus]|uniref:LuxR family two component transcriptional regulator n=1 Tax=Luteibacter rhizovicinus TaxID=242606 RepID=A0A4R3YNN4_9GAMM|nr:response regulator transcription factor [Luteibacter rhizovicinus]TCV93941.1 LuxR family two component transcriptional regulator [Luteibacter rhizovicinus]